MTSRQWPWVLVGVSAVYLVVELAFNIRLVDNAMATDPEVVESLELWGRSIAATGCAVAILRLLPLQWIRSRLPVCVGVLLAAWLTTFFGQKSLIEWYVDSSTQAQRLDAWHVALLKQGLDSGAIQLEGLKTSTGDAGRDKTLLSMLGLISYSLPEYVQLLKSRSEEIALSIADRRATDGIEPLYDGFIELRSELKSRFENGLQAQELARSYPPVLQRELGQFFTERRHCEQEATPSYVQACIDAVDSAYNKKMQSAVGKEIPWKEFCRPAPASTTYQMRAGKMVPIVTDSLNCQDIEASRIESVLLQALGIKYRFDSWRQFTRIPEVQAALREHIGIDGFVDPDMDKARFLEAVAKPEFRVQAQAEREKWLSASISNDEGRRAVRAVVVHPIALGFSLFFGMVNAVGLIAALGRIWGGPAFGHSLNMGLLAGAVLVPFVVGGGAGINISEFVKVAPGELGVAMHWVMTVEPWIYNIVGGIL